MAAALNFCVVAVAPFLTDNHAEFFRILVYSLSAATISEFGLIEYYASRGFAPRKRSNDFAHIIAIVFLGLALSWWPLQSAAVTGYVITNAICIFYLRKRFGIAQAKASPIGLGLCLVAIAMLKIDVLLASTFFSDWREAVGICAIFKLSIGFLLFLRDNEMHGTEGTLAAYIVALLPFGGGLLVSFAVQRLDVMVVSLWGSDSDISVYFAVSTFALAYQLISRAWQMEVLSIPNDSGVARVVCSVERRKLHAMVFTIVNIPIIIFVAPWLFIRLIPDFSLSHSPVVWALLSLQLCGLNFVGKDAVLLKWNAKLSAIAKIICGVATLSLLSVIFLMDAVSLEAIAAVALIARAGGWLYIEAMYRRLKTRDLHF